MMKLDIQFFAENGINVEIGITEVKYTKVYSGNEVKEVIADVRVPATNGNVSGYITLGEIEGWTLSGDKTTLTKSYTTNQTETIKIVFVEFDDIQFVDASTFELIQIYDISESEHLRSTVTYTLESDGDVDSVANANVTVYIKDAHLGSYVISKNNVGWTVSNDQTSATQTVTINDGHLNQLAIYPAGETESDENVIFEDITYLVENVGLTVAGIKADYENIYSNESIVGTKVTLTVPYTIGETTGNASIVKLDGDGWLLTKNNTILTKTFLENTTETVRVQIGQANGYEFETTRTSEIVVDVIEYKKVVKGRCETTKCMYDVYTKAEVDNLKLKMESGQTGNLAILTGTMILTANTEENASDNFMMLTTEKIDYPQGFTPINCIAVAFGVKMPTKSSYYYGNIPENLISYGLMTGLVPKTIELTENKILVNMWNPAISEKRIDYKIVLMKTE